MGNYSQDLWHFTNLQDTAVLRLVPQIAACNWLEANNLRLDCSYSYRILFLVSASRFQLRDWQVRRVHLQVGTGNLLPADEAQGLTIRIEGLVASARRYADKIAGLHIDALVPN